MTDKIKNYALIIVSVLLLLATKMCYSQTKTVCTGYETYKGKKNHGQKYCVSWADVVFKNGQAIDTVGWSSSGTTWFGDEYEAYKVLNERNKFIYDSLQEDGILSFYRDNSLQFEPMYMKGNVSKYRKYCDARGDKVYILTYLLWHKQDGSSGIKFISEEEQP